MQGAQQDITLRVLMMEEIRRLNASLEERIAQRTGELARQEALFRTLAEQAPLPFWTVDPQRQPSPSSAAPGTSWSAARRRSGWATNGCG